MSRFLIVLALLAQESPEVTPRNMRLELSASGNLTIRGESVSERDYSVAFKRQVASGIREFSLHADGSVPFSSVQTLMAAAREAGIESVQFATDMPASPAKITADSRKSLRIKLREGEGGVEILVLKESAVGSLEQLRTLLKAEDKTQVIVDADSGVAYGAVRQIVTSCTDEGFRKVSFAAPPKKTDSRDGK